LSACIEVKLLIDIIIETNRIRPIGNCHEVSGWISLTYRGKPFVAMNNDDSNIISARLGAN
jgi:hypothetical protein